MIENTQAQATDPVCGMTVDVASARTAGWTAEHEGATYSFCGKGCLLDFRDDPDRYLDPTYTPSM
jgi:YHS domain-containing protein